MITKLNEYLIPSYELTKEETQELLESGYVETEDGFCITYTDDGFGKEIRIYKEFDEYDGLTLYKEDK